MNKSSTGMANNIGTRARLTSIFQAHCIVPFLFVINLFVVNIFITSIIIFITSVVIVIPPLTSSSSPSLALCFSPSVLNIYICMYVFMYVCNDTSRMNIVVCLLYIQPGEITAIANINFVFSVSIVNSVSGV
jgi:hypothetical protein